MMNKKILVALAAVLFSAIAFAQQNNPRAFLKDKEQVKTLATLRSVDGTRLYSMDYKADYRLQDVINASLPSQSELIEKCPLMLLDTKKMALAKGYVDKPACAAFTAKTPEGDLLYCRNFDYSTFDDGANIILRTSPKKGYRSVSMIAASFPGFKGTQLSDGKTDLSGLVMSPYCQMDGMNEKGFCISVLQLRGESAAQYIPGKPSVMTSVMMRMVLDRAANVDEALALINGINFFTNKDLIGQEKSCNYHFFLSDKTGRSVVLEFIRKDGPNTDSPWVANILEESSVTNNYLSKGWETVSYNPKDKRLDVIRETLAAAKGSNGAQGTLSEAKGSNGVQGTLSEADAMALLSKVSQKHTQWSIVYNITKQTATICMQKDYNKTNVFKLKGKKGWTK